MFIDQTYSKQLNAKIAAWEARFNDYFLALPTTERPLTSVEYLTTNGFSTDADKRAAYDQFMRDAQARVITIRQRYMETVEAYPVKRFK
jgi:hypothetical protein